MDDAAPPAPAPLERVRVRRYDPHAASEAEQRAFYDFQLELARERLPDDPDRPFDSWRRNQLAWREVASIEVAPLLAWLEDRVLGMAFCALPRIDAYAHHMQLSLEVRPEARRRGLGRRLLREAVQLARARARTRIYLQTTDTQPAGSAVLEHLGLVPGLSAHTNQLRLDRLDRELLRRWIGAAPTDDYRLESLPDPVPDDALDVFLALAQVMHDQPKGELEDIREPIDRAEWREFEAYNAARGVEVARLVARHRESGAMAGYTEMSWNPDKPELVTQGDTGVDPEHRGHGLGKWLKAAMLERLLADRPGVRAVRTGNADSNAPMLAINRRLGFEPYIAERVWEVPLERLERYLEGRASGDVSGASGEGEGAAADS